MLRTALRKAEKDIRLVTSAVYCLIKEQEEMKNDFTRLSADLDALAAEVAEVATILRTPTNNDQATINAMADRLEAVTSGLKTAATPEAETPAVEKEAPADANEAPAA